MCRPGAKPEVCTLARTANVAGSGCSRPRMALLRLF